MGGATTRSFSARKVFLSEKCRLPCATRLTAPAAVSGEPRNELSARDDVQNMEWMSGVCGQRWAKKKT